MTLKSLLDKQSAIDTVFAELQAEKKQHVDKTAELDLELVKLQGEYRLVTELIDNYKEKKNAR